MHYPEFEIIHVDCSCLHPEHQLRFHYDPEFYGEDVEERGLLQVEVFLTDGGFWRRLKTGIKYIFGHKSSFGHFDEILIDKPEIVKLQQLLNSITKTAE